VTFRDAAAGEFFIPRIAYTSTAEDDFRLCSFFGLESCLKSFSSSATNFSGSSKKGGRLQLRES